MRITPYNTTLSPRNEVPFMAKKTPKTNFDWKNWKPSQALIDSFNRSGREAHKRGITVQKMTVLDEADMTGASSNVTAKSPAKAKNPRKKM